MAEDKCFEKLLSPDPYSSASWPALRVKMTMNLRRVKLKGFQMGVGAELDPLQGLSKQRLRNRRKEVLFFLARFNLTFEAVAFASRRPWPKR